MPAATQNRPPRKATSGSRPTKAAAPAAQPAKRGGKHAAPAASARKVTSTTSRVKSPAQVETSAIPVQRAAEPTAMQPTVEQPTAVLPGPSAAMAPWGPPQVPGQVSGQQRPGFFARRGVQLVLVGITTFVVGLVIGTAATGNASGRDGTVENTAAAAKDTDKKAPAATGPAAKKDSSAKGTSAKKSTATQGGNTADKATTPKTVAAPTLPGDKGWTVQSLNVIKDYVGEFGGSARITNTNGSTQTGMFTITLFRDGKQLAVLDGVADKVAPGKTVTVDLMSTDDYSSGSFTYEFQADLSY